MPREFPFAVTAPVWLWLLLLAPAAWWVGRRGLAALGPGRRRWALALRLAVLACLALALADARVRWRPDETTVIFAIDRSESVGEAEGDRALALVNQALALKPSRDRAGVVVFGEEALVERAPTPALKRVERLDSAPGRGFTDLGKALRLSAGLFPEGGRRRLVLFTDGNENLGSAAAEAASCAAQGIAVDVVPMRAAARDEVLVDAVQAPDRVEKKKPFEVKVTVRSTFSGPGTLRLYRTASSSASRRCG